MADWGFGKLMAFLWHKGSHAVEIHHNSFPVYEGEYPVGTVFHASGLAIWGATVAFFWENCRIPWSASAS